MKLIYLTLLSVATSYAGFDIQEAIDSAKSGAVISVPEGVYRTPLSIKKGLTLSGKNAVLEVVSNQPAVLIDSYKLVQLEGMTIKWKSKNKPQKGDTPYAVFVRNGDVSIKNCTFEALGNGDASPGAVSAQDRAEVEISTCRFTGFEYTIQFWNGAEGSVADCIIINPGHCGISIGTGSSGKLTRNIVTGSRYHGIRCTGGKIEAISNLVIRNKNRAFYIGNRSAIGEISNNLIVENATGINVFANSKLEIDHNVIIRNSYAGLAIADTAKLEIENNIIAENETGVVGFAEKKESDLSVPIKGKNLLSGNKVAAEHIDLPSKTLEKDPAFSNPDEGLFKSAVAGMGLENPAELQKLWIKWQAALDNR